jgi:hypothetical protein
MRKMECGAAPRENQMCVCVCACVFVSSGCPSTLGQAKSVCVCVCVCSCVCVGLRPRHMLSIPSTKLKMECGAAERKNNRKLERVCRMECGAAQREKQ